MISIVINPRGLGLLYAAPRPEMIWIGSEDAPSLYYNYPNLPHWTYSCPCPFDLPQYLPPAHILAQIETEDDLSNLPNILCWQAMHKLYLIKSDVFEDASLMINTSNKLYIKKIDSYLVSTGYGALDLDCWRPDCPCIQKPKDIIFNKDKVEGIALPYNYASRIKRELEEDSVLIYRDYLESMVGLGNVDWGLFWNRTIEGLDKRLGL